jgi:LysM repeat protein
MRQLIISFLSALLFIPSIIFAQNRPSRRDYIETYKVLAVREMFRSGIPASITLAQGCLESENGNSPLAKSANNHFGIKCKKEWKGERSYHDDDEKGECFRKYRDANDSYIDHTDYLVQTPRYGYLFKLSRTDYNAWAHGLKAAGYATDPNYAARLIKIIEDEKLFVYDSLESGDLPPQSILAREGKKSDQYLAKEKHQASFKNITINPYSRRETFKINDLEIVYVKAGDTYESIANEFDMKEWEIHAYNNIRKDAAQPEPETFLFIQRKKCRAQKGTETHVVQPRETMYSISQKYGVSLSALYFKNRMKKGTEPVAGSKVYLRKMKPRPKKY